MFSMGKRYIFDPLLYFVLRRRQQRIEAVKMVCAVSGLSAEMDRADVPHFSGQLPKDNKDFE